MGPGMGQESELFVKSLYISASHAYLAHLFHSFTPVYQPNSFPAPLILQFFQLALVAFLLKHLQHGYS